MRNMNEKNTCCNCFMHQMYSQFFFLNDIASFALSSRRTLGNKFRNKQQKSRIFVRNVWLLFEEPFHLSSIQTEQFYFGSCIAF